MNTTPTITFKQAIMAWVVFVVAMIVVGNIIEFIAP